MVRLVFRPYTQVRRSICTSDPLRASTRVSPGFTLPRHSSPSFGSQQPCSVSMPQANPWLGRCGMHRQRSLSLRTTVFHRCTRTLAGLLGPCFKTGRLAPLSLAHRSAPTQKSRKLFGGGSHPTPRRQSVPCQQFHALLTPFPRSFSVFPHGTCSLSVSRSYLALDGVYHPLQTAIPNSPTRRTARDTQPPSHRNLTFSVRPFRDR